MSRPKLERIIKFSPAFDKTNTDPKKNYGIGSVRCWMILKGKLGAVQFMWNTGIYLPSVQAKYRHKDLGQADGWDVGYHSLYKIRDWHDKPSQEHCEFLDDRPCYYDGSALRAIEWFKIFVSEGDEAIWALLNEYYIETFKSME